MIHRCTGTSRYFFAMIRISYSEQAIVIFSVILLADTNACEFPMSAVQTSKPTRQYPSCFVGMYRIVYRIVTTVSGYVSYHGKMYHCRPSSMYVLAKDILQSCTLMCRSYSQVPADM